MDTYEGIKKAVTTQREGGKYTNLNIDLSCIEGTDTEKRRQVALILTNVTIKKILPVWLEEWLREGFYYEDDYEIEAIVEHARELFFNPSLEVPLKTSFLKWQKEMYQLYYQFIQDSMQFSFDSFMTFRFRKNKEQLSDVVEKAIDEYKMEYDYQIMVNTCREFLQRNSPRIHTVHLYLEDDIKMVNFQGESITTEQIRRWLTNDLSFDSWLPVAERVIGPLVCIAPKKLIIHPCGHHEGLLQTLLSIFEERVELRNEKKTGNWLF